MVLKRSKRFGVGKEIGGSIYIHREYESILPMEFSKAKAVIPERLGGKPYTLIKYNRITGAYTFIWCDNFDTAHEPTMGVAIIVSNSLQIRTMWPPKNSLIYHHKWLMVKDNYSGFDVEASKARSEIWTGLKNIDKSRIGSKSYWEENVVPLLQL